MYEMHGETSPAIIPQRTRTKVLLVDDEPRILSSLHALLEHRGFDLANAVNGAEAIASLTRSTFDLVILDLQMPGIGGHEVMDFIKSQHHSASVIVISGSQEIDAAIGALKRGASGYLRKPYSREELEITVDNVLQYRNLQSENRRIAQKLQRSERSYRFLVDQSPDIIYTLDDEGQFTFVNDRVNQLLGFDHEELVGKHYSILVHEEDMEQANYVFNAGKNDQRVSRSVELRLKSSHGHGETRVFNHELMTISSRTGLGGLEPTAGGGNLLGIYGVARDITDRQRADALISFQAHHDILTGLPNRVLFRNRLELAVLQARRNRVNLAVIFIDLDRFKIVNDTLGHAMGDKLLQQVAARLTVCLRRSDTLSRQGGDEFTVVLPDLRHVNDAARIAENFLESLRAPFLLAGQQVRLSASVGIAVYPMDGESVDELLKYSDIAMYHMKSLGKNGHCFFERSMLEASSRKIELERSLHLALEHGELEMYYQPQMDVRSGRIIGAEALMRWNHPQRGLLSAGEFLPFSEESGLIIPISDWMLESISQNLLEWNLAGGKDVRLSFNLSPQYLDRGDFYEKLSSALHRHGISPSQIEVEVTENICIRNAQTAIDQLSKLGELGVSVAIDDFGTGYSSLSYLHKFPIHTIKIDRSFVMEIQDEGALSPVVMAIILIARGLGLALVAEGVETEAQERYLEKSGCHIMQGYRYHKPVSHLQLVDLLRLQVTAFDTGRSVSLKSDHV